MAVENKKQLVPLVENILAPEVFADGIDLIAVGNGTITISLTSMRWDNSTRPPQQKRVVVGRLTLPVSTTRNLVTSLGEYLRTRVNPATSSFPGTQMQ